MTQELKQDVYNLIKNIQGKIRDLDVMNILRHEEEINDIAQRLEKEI